MEEQRLQQLRVQTLRRVVVVARLHSAVRSIAEAFAWEKSKQRAGLITLTGGHTPTVVRRTGKKREDEEGRGEGVLM